MLAREVAHMTDDPGPPTGIGTTTFWKWASSHRCTSLISAGTTPCTHSPKRRFAPFAVHRYGTGAVLNRRRARRERYNRAALQEPDQSGVVVARQPTEAEVWRAWHRCDSK